MFELYYSTGGHGGPYENVFNAKTSALRLLAGNYKENWIDVKQRSTGIVVARIAREHLTEFYRMGEINKVVKMDALFNVNIAVTLSDVTDIELNNSEVLHPDVLQMVKALLQNDEMSAIHITLVDAYEFGTEGGSENG